MTGFSRSFYFYFVDVFIETGLGQLTTSPSSVFVKSRMFLTFCRRGPIVWFEFDFRTSAALTVKE